MVEYFEAIPQQKKTVSSLNDVKSRNVVTSQETETAFRALDLRFKVTLAR